MLLLMKVIPKLSILLLLSDIKLFQLTWKLYMLTLMLAMNELLNLYKKIKKTVTSYKVRMYHQ